MNIKLVIFDLDGTLMNAYPAVYRSVNYAVKSFGYPAIDHATIKATVGWGDRHLLKAFVGQRHLEQILAVYRKHHAVSLKKDTKLLPGALKLLQYLKSKSIKIAVASNRPTRFSLIAIRCLKIKKFFDCILCGDKVQRAKPAPDILRAILKKFSLKPSQVLYVGDMQIDITTGRRAKIKTVAVATGSSTKKQLLAGRPYVVIDRVDEVKKFLD